MGNIRSRRGFSLLEAILSISILLLLAGLLLSAVFHVREAASKAACSNQLRQIGLALQQYHNAHSLFPPGMTHLHKSKRSNYAPYGPDVDSFPLLHWHARLLPYLEQENLWALTVKAFSIEPIYLNNPPHEARNQVIALFQCPTEDPNIEGAFNFPTATSYMGVAGTKSRAENGILFLDSRVHLSDVTDGASNTLIAGDAQQIEKLRSGAGMEISREGTDWMHISASLRTTLELVGWTAAQTYLTNLGQVPSWTNAP